MFVSKASISIPDARSLIVHIVLAKLMTRFYNISPPYYVLQEKEGIEKWSESSPRLNKSQIRPTDQRKQICKRPFQC